MTIFQIRKKAEQRNFFCKAVSFFNQTRQTFLELFPADFPLISWSQSWVMLPANPDQSLAKGTAAAPTGFDQTWFIHRHWEHGYRSQTVVLWAMKKGVWLLGISPSIFQRGEYRHESPLTRALRCWLLQTLLWSAGQALMTVWPSRVSRLVASCSKEGGIAISVGCTVLPGSQQQCRPFFAGMSLRHPCPALWFLFGDFTWVPAGVGSVSYPFSSLFSHLHSRG